MGNPVPWFEVDAPNSLALRGFHADLFDWQIEPCLEGLQYAIVDTGAEGGFKGVPGARTFAHFADREGNALGIYRPADR